MLAQLPLGHVKRAVHVRQCGCDFETERSVRELGGLQWHVPVEPPLDTAVPESTEVTVRDPGVAQSRVRRRLDVAVDHALGAEDPDEDGIEVDERRVVPLQLFQRASERTESTHAIQSVGDTAGDPRTRERAYRMQAGNGRPVDGGRENGREVVSDFLRIRIRLRGPLSQVGGIGRLGDSDRVHDDRQCGFDDGRFRPGGIDDEIGKVGTSVDDGREEFLLPSQARAHVVGWRHRIVKVGGSGRAGGKDRTATVGRWAVDGRGEGEVGMILFFLWERVI